MPLQSLTTSGHCDVSAQDIEFYKILTAIVRGLGSKQCFKIKVCDWGLRHSTTLHDSYGTNTLFYDSFVFTVCANSSEMLSHYHTCTPLMSRVLCFPSELETAERRQVLGLLAGDAPVVGLVDRLVVFPGRFVVHGQSLDGLGGERLRWDWDHDIKTGYE